MPMIAIALVVVLLAPLQTGAPAALRTLQPDVDRLVRAAENAVGTWPSQPPPAVPEVAIVARHGKAVVPLLMVLLSDDPDAERDPRRWKVQQQVALTLSRIYPESEHCGRIYCDGDPPQRIARIKEGWLRVIASDAEMHALSARELLDRFKAENVSWRQLGIGRALAAAGDRRAIAELETWLTHEDRHLRGNAAFVVGRLGDPRGFQVIAAILADRSPRSEGQGIPGGRWSLQGQIRADRYYAAHLLGNLRDPAAVPLLVSLLRDEAVRFSAPWALAQIGDRRAVAPLIELTQDDDASTRVMAAWALGTLNAREAVPRLRELLNDTRPSSFGGRTTVAEAARHAIATISQLP